MENNIIVQVYVQNKKTLEGGAQMQVTEVRIRKVDSGNRMKAIAQVTFDNEFVVHEIKVIEGQDGLFIAMPRKERNGRFMDIAHPINQETRDKIEKAILEAYAKEEDSEKTAESDTTDAE